MLTEADLIVSAPANILSLFDSLTHTATHLAVMTRPTPTNPIFSPTWRWTSIVTLPGPWSSFNTAGTTCETAVDVHSIAAERWHLRLVT